MVTSCVDVWAPRRRRWAVPGAGDARARGRSGAGWQRAARGGHGDVAVAVHGRGTQTTLIDLDRRRERAVGLRGRHQVLRGRGLVDGAHQVTAEGNHRLPARRGRGRGLRTTGVVAERLLWSVAQLRRERERRGGLYAVTSVPSAASATACAHAVSGGSHARHAVRRAPQQPPTTRAPAPQPFDPSRPLQLADPDRVVFGVQHAWKRLT